ncbi:CMP deaminase [Brazilian cedratvirus IHUMI]|uniref:CMP deaminase n=1 Tax=Brazilian cedratvirus IHUMI TaxID=2126980 RepID=A0A2R8FF58_9VIRU|nr:CMP deaminase [Brazilian cedratvirus IHUMI]
MDFYVEAATKEALKSNMRHRYGAVLVYRGKIVSKGHNLRVLPHWWVDDYRFSLHAEQMCINRCKDKTLLPKCTLVLVRVCNITSQKKQKLVYIPSYPCAKCLHIIEKYSVAKIYHT